jgi:hypothetical protein
VEKYDYEYQPHEIEAREQEETLYEQYMEEVHGVCINNSIVNTVSRHLL